MPHMIICLNLLDLLLTLFHILDLHTIDTPTQPSAAALFEPTCYSCTTGAQTWLGKFGGAGTWVLLPVSC